MKESQVARVYRGGLRHAPQRTCSTDFSSLAERFLLPLELVSVAGLVAAWSDHQEGVTWRESGIVAPLTSLGSCRHVGDRITGNTQGKERGGKGYDDAAKAATWAAAAGATAMAAGATKAAVTAAAAMGAAAMGFITAGEAAIALSAV